MTDEERTGGVLGILAKAQAAAHANADFLAAEHMRDATDDDLDWLTVRIVHGICAEKALEQLVEKYRCPICEGTGWDNNMSCRHCDGKGITGKGAVLLSGWRDGLGELDTLLAVETIIGNSSDD